MHLYILGFMGSGKTTLFKKWQSQYEGLAFDFDHELARRLGLRPDELGQWIEENGWDDFRTKESELLVETLKKGEGLYCLGGGTFSKENIEKFNSFPKAETLWLNTPVEICWDRVKEDRNRPLVKQGKDEFFSLYKARESQYSKSKYQLSGENNLPEWEEFWKNYVINPSL